MNARQLYFYSKLKEVIEGKGGKLLSDYINAKTKVTVQCEEGHTWPATQNSLTNHTHQSWCPKCSVCPPITLEELHDYARLRGGKCLSEVYDPQKILWECINGHQWYARASNVLSQQSWCGVCAARARCNTIEEMRDIASKHNGKCLSPIYFESLKKLMWLCENGHTFFAIPQSVKKGSWCMQCYRDQIMHTLEEFQERATKLGGKCISDEYTGILNYLTFECNQGHQFECRASHFLYDNTWCSTCTSSAGEITCALTLSKLCIKFEPQFKIVSSIIPNRRYDFAFEYSEKKFLLEYDGEQHFNFKKLFHQTDSGFLKHRQIDVLKTKVALEHGYHVIRIDYKQVPNISELIEHFINNDEKFQCTNPELYSWIIQEL